MTVIDEAMRQIFINTCLLYQAEREYNYQNYGKYPYRDRKNSVQIVADFNVDAYSINGLFVAEDSYTEYYPPQIIESVESVLIDAVEAQTIVYDAFIVINNGLDGTEENQTIYQNAVEIAGSAARFENVVTREYVELEAVTVQTLRYVFPFNCVPDNLGRLVLSF